MSAGDPVPVQIAEAFATLVAALAEVENALDYEPGTEGLPAKKPCVTMMYLGGRPTEQFTGGEDMEWVWEVFTYVEMRRDFRTATKQLMAVDAALKNLVRDNFRLGLDGTGGEAVVDKTVLEEPLAKISLDEAAGLAFRTNRLVVTTTET